MASAESVAEAMRRLHATVTHAVRSEHDMSAGRQPRLRGLQQRSREFSEELSQRVAAGTEMLGRYRKILTARDVDRKRRARSSLFQTDSSRSDSSLDAVVSEILIELDKQWWAFRFLADGFHEALDEKHFALERLAADFHSYSDCAEDFASLAASHNKVLEAEARFKDSLLAVWTRGAPLFGLLVSLISDGDVMQRLAAYDMRSITPSVWLDSIGSQATCEFLRHANASRSIQKLVFATLQQGYFGQTANQFMITVDLLAGSRRGLDKLVAKGERGVPEDDGSVNGSLIRFLDVMNETMPTIVQMQPELEHDLIETLTQQLSCAKEATLNQEIKKVSATVTSDGEISLHSIARHELDHIKSTRAHLELTLDEIRGKLNDMKEEEIVLEAYVESQGGGGDSAPTHDAALSPVAPHNPSSTSSRLSTSLMQANRSAKYGSEDCTEGYTEVCKGQCVMWPSGKKPKAQVYRGIHFDNGACAVYCDRGHYGDWTGTCYGYTWEDAGATCYLWLEQPLCGTFPEQSAGKCCVKHMDDQCMPPTPSPTESPTLAPTPWPTHTPTPALTLLPTRAPTQGPTEAPTPEPTPWKPYAHPNCEAGAKSFECFSTSGYCLRQCRRKWGDCLNGWRACLYRTIECTMQKVMCAAGTTCKSNHSVEENPCVSVNATSALSI
eukprot:TRINITY_DN39362_c0_g1_i1.p1 TRINITY_DN39362_c0_g1~~TRINITY_DN39362_c0_g1_i1.p1  ORF type:complete len:682 (+),score=67.49 TRINITY_DN39362_c0_g1_i1:43-2046(+)